MKSQFYIDEDLSVVEFKDLCEAWQHIANAGV